VIFPRTFLCAILALVSAVSFSATFPTSPQASSAISKADAPQKGLFVTGGLWHDYKKLPPYITKKIAEKDHVQFQTLYGVDLWKDAKFADGYDFMVYDICYDDVDAASLDNALAVGKRKPTIFLHCAVHSFRNSPKVHEWEDYVGLRSKVHDKYGPFEIVELTSGDPILRGLPPRWATKGDELYQTIELIAGSHALLQATSPRDNRTHTVAWTHQYGDARVFGTTLGHDKKTAQTNEYKELLANAVQWVTGRD
jgi:uncharacterized protein